MAKLYGEWKVALPDESWDWFPDDMTVGESNLIETELDMSFDDWVDAIDARRAMACQVLVWFLKLKAGQNEERTSINFPIRRLELKRIPKEPSSTPETSGGSTSVTSPESDIPPET